MQLRSYLEALLSDVETEWGRADPAALPGDRPRPPAQRSVADGGPAGATTFVGNTAAEAPLEPAVGTVPAAAGPEPSS